VEVRTWPDIGDPNDIRFAALWLPPEGLFGQLPNLTHIFALSAGVDKLLQAPDLPTDIPIYRLEDGGMAEPMSEYVLYGVLHAQRQFPALMIAQQQQQWVRDAIEPRAKDWQVGILGAGVLASAAARRLVNNGYPVRTWSRTRKSLSGVQSFAGAAELTQFCHGINTLVCLLPLTTETKGILNASLFSHLPAGASLINAARGEHCVDADLLQALDNGTLCHALLDVFHQEPLPPEHPFWSHPRVQITPHIAAPTSGDDAANGVAKAVAEALAGREPAGLVDRKNQY